MDLRSIPVAPPARQELVEKQLDLARRSLKNGGAISTSQQLVAKSIKRALTPDEVSAAQVLQGLVDKKKNRADIHKGTAGPNKGFWIGPEGLVAGRKARMEQRLREEKTAERQKDE